MSYERCSACKEYESHFAIAFLCYAVLLVMRATVLGDARYRREHHHRETYRHAFFLTY